MGRGDFILYKNTERHFEVRHLSFITSYVVIYLDFHSAKRTLWLDDSWLRAPDQMETYPDLDTIEQLLPGRQIQQHMKEGSGKKKSFFAS